MSKAAKISGQWWLPTSPDERWIGTLTIKPGKSPRLTVTVPKGHFQLTEPQPPPVIHGHDEHGRPITILFPGWPSSRSAAAISQMDFTAGYAVLGVQLPNATDLNVHNLSFGVQHLHEWTPISGFIRHEHDTALESHIHHKRPEDQTFALTPGLSLTLSGTTSGHTTMSERVLREDVCILFESDPELGLARVNELVTAVRQMLHFAVLKPVYPMWLSVGRRDYGVTIEGRFRPHDVKVWNSIFRERVKSEIEGGRWVFRFSDIQAHFGHFFADWLSFCERYGEALRCYSTTVYHSLPDSVQHLCLAQALEAYHGTKFGDAFFGTRVQSLAQQFLPHLTGLVANPAAFAEQVRDNRNYYTHHDPAIKRAGRVLSGADLLRLNEMLKLIFQMCVLTEMGIPSDRFARLRRQLATFIVDYI